MSKNSKNGKPEFSYKQVDGSTARLRSSNYFEYHGDCALTEAIRKRYQAIVDEAQLAKWEAEQVAAHRSTS